MNAPAMSTASPALDLLQHLAVRVPCASCGQHYDVPLRQVLLSQEMLHEGCPVCSETECLPLTYAALAHEAALREFERSWQRFLADARTLGFELRICHPTRGH